MAKHRILVFLQGFVALLVNLCSTDSIAICNSHTMWAIWYHFQNQLESWPLNNIKVFLFPWTFNIDRCVYLCNWFYQYLDSLYFSLNVEWLETCTIDSTVAICFTYFYGRRISYDKPTEWALPRISKYDVGICLK